MVVKSGGKRKVEKVVGEKKNRCGWQKLVDGSVKRKAGWVVEHKSWLNKQKWLKEMVGVEENGGKELLVEKSC